jgi:hypothetical protein
VVLAAGYHPRHSALGITWTAVTAAVMFALAGADSDHQDADCALAAAG